MHSLLLIATGVLPILYIGNYYVCFARNLRAAKASGIHYVIHPVNVFNRFWLIAHPVFLPILRKLPKSWTESWIDFMSPEWVWEIRYSPFQKMGVDTFLTVTPGGNLLYTGDANVITQIANRRNDFPKPIQLYKSLNLFGINVVSTEGSHWRRHRKITSPPFTEKNNHMVWAESLHTTQTMISSWVGRDGNKMETVQRIADDAMRLSLHVISQAGFGVKLLWPGVEDDQAKTPTLEEGAHSKINNQKTSGNHKMSYTYAIHSVLANIMLIMLVPDWLLKRLPFNFARHAHESYVEWGTYMKEMYERKKAEFRKENPSNTRMDLMGALIKGAGIKPDTPNGADTGPVESGKESAQALTEEEILGNAFVFILAGHETAANVVHFSVLNLALNMDSQRRLQKDLDSIFQGRPISEWDYDRDLPRLFGGMAGAVMNEVLRLVPPITNIPKMTGDRPQPLNIDGKTVTVPANTQVKLCSIAAHRNPKYWPHGPPSDPEHPAHPTSNLDNDLEEFKPERWLLDGSNTDASFMPGQDEKNVETDDLGVNTASDTSASLYSPPRGAYIPFSEGYRSCLGRRFAQVEVLAVLAVIFTLYSVELAVDDYATDAEVDDMSVEERKVVWNKARDRARWLMSEGMGSVITLQMRAGHVPLRFVHRGKERFNFS